MTIAYKTVESELSSLLRGECRFDDAAREQFSTTPSWYKITPIGVVFPSDIEDVQKAVQFCAQNDIPLIPRGGGTGLAGQAIGMGIVLDFSRSMNRILNTSSDAVVVEPGVILQSLNEQLAPQNRFFPVDPVSGKLCTIGGMVSTNAAGPHGVKYGAMKDHVESLTVVLSNGETGQISFDNAPDNSRERSLLGQIKPQLEAILMSKKDLILRKFPNVAKNSSGYNLRDAVKESTLDLRKLIVGSEGTLALVVGARLRVSELPKFRSGAVAYFRDYTSTVEATIRGLGTQPCAIELMDRTYFMLGVGFSAATDALIRGDAATMLYFEYEGSSDEGVRSALSELSSSLQPCHPLKLRLLDNAAERQRLLDLREAVSKKMNFEDTFGKSSFIEDVAVPIQNMPAYISGLSEILRRYGIGFSAYGHAGVGNIHCGTFVDITDERYFGVIDRVASEVNDLAISLGGTLSGEHGDGFVRTPFLERLYGAEVYGLFKEVKNAFDPSNILNPGKIIGPQNTTILHDVNLS